VVICEFKKCLIAPEACSKGASVFEKGDIQWALARRMPGQIALLYCFSLQFEPVFFIVYTGLTDSF